MAAIADTIIARIEALGYPTDETHADPSERRAAQHERQLTVRAIEDHFATELADVYLEGISEARRREIGSLIYQQAHADGHSSGYHGIENSYIDLAEMAMRIYAIATS